MKHIYTARTCLYGCQQIRQVHMYESYHLYSCLTSTLERQKRHITIADLQAKFLRGVAAHCDCIFYQIFLRIIICKFSLHISMNYTENIAELLVQAQKVDTRHSLIFGAPGNEATSKLHDSFKMDFAQNISILH